MNKCGVRKRVGWLLMNKNAFLIKFLLYIPVKLIPALLGIFFIFFLYKFFPGGQYVSYSICLTCALIASQLCTGWVGNSFIYYFSGSKDKTEFISSCLLVIGLLAPAAAFLAATVSIFFVPEHYVFLCVGGLCFSQVIFFFLSSVCQADFLVKHQLVSVLIQAMGQVSLISLLFYLYGVDFRYAIVSLAIGYFLAAFYLVFSVLRKFGFNNPLANFEKFRVTLRLIYQYGAALSPWMLGMLVMVGADRFAIGYYGVEHGDSYLSLKDLFVGAAGLLSMPLLMLVHPLVIKKFREGYFAATVIEGSMGFLIIAFSLMWGALDFVGFDFFEWITGKTIGAPRIVIFISFLGVFFNSVSVYVQKRLEVHRKMKRLAYLSLISALVSIVFSCVGGGYWGIYGVAIGVLLAQLLYFYMVTISVFRKLNLFHCFGLPLVVSFMTYLFGYGYYLLIELLWEAGEWWMKSIFWLVGFIIVALLTLWKGVEWNKFMRESIG